MSQQQMAEIEAQRQQAQRETIAENAMRGAVTELMASWYDRTEIKAAVDRIFDARTEETARRLYRTHYRGLLGVYTEGDVTTGRPGAQDR